jgi:hypothetical protein
MPVERRAWDLIMAFHITQGASCIELGIDAVMLGMVTDGTFRHLSLLL